MVFPSVVSARAVRELRKIEDELFQKLIGNWSTSGSLEKDCKIQHWFLVGNRNRWKKREVSMGGDGVSLEGKLKFEIVSFSVDNVLRGRMESEFIEVISETVPEDGVLVRFRSSSGKQISGVEEIGIR
jgi:hypothetical protein